MSAEFARFSLGRIARTLTCGLLVTIAASCAERRVNVPNPTGDSNRPANVGEEHDADRVEGREQKREGEGGKKPGTDQPEGALLHRLLALRDENGAIPLFGLSRARRERQALIDASPQTPTIAGITNGSWTSIGPGNIGGRLRSVVIHPTTPDTMFVGGVDGGIWRTTNGGVTWTPMNDFLANLAVSSIVMQPGNPNVMYAATGEGFYNADGVRGEGIFKSTNGGVAWTQLPATLTTDYLYVNRLAMSADGTTLLAVTRTGLFRSIDGGVSFTKTLNVTGVGFNDVGDVKFLAGSSTLAVASGFARNAFWSDNGGLSWTQATGLVGVSPSGNFNHRVELAVATSNPSIVYASVWGQPGVPQGQLWKSTDAGHSYVLVSTPNHLGSQGWYDNAIWIDPTNPDVVIVGGIDLFRSIDGGIIFTKISNWAIAPASAHADHHTVVAHPGFNGTSNKTVFFGNDGGIYRATDVYAPLGGTTIPFTELNNNLGVTQFYGGAANVATGKVLGGTQDNGTLLYTPAGGAEGWTTMFGGDGGAAAIDHVDPNYMYGEYVYARVHRSANGGVSASYIYGQGSGGANGCKAVPYAITEACVSSANFISPFVLDRNNTNRMLVGALSLWRTDDVRTVNTSTTGPTWTVIKPPSVSSPISAIAIANGNADIVWVGHNNGDVYFTINGTTAVPFWTKVDANPGPLPNRQITSIAIHPTDHTAVFVTLGGFSTDNVYRTSNSGGNWTESTGGTAPTGLPNVPVRTLAIHPVNPGWIYAGTEVGVFASETNGATWGVPNDGPANVAIYELFWMGTNLIAATHGRGMFTTPTGGAPPTSVITRSPSQLNFGATKTSADGPIVHVTPGQTVTVGYTGTAPVWTATSNQPWAVVTGGSGTGGGQFSVSIANPGNVIGGSTPLFATITISAPTAASVTVAVRLAVQFIPGPGALPVGQVDTPAQNATGQVGAIGVTGWVVDDIGVNTVGVYRPCLGIDVPASCQIILGQNLVFVGNGIFLAGARPDVEAAFPMLPQSYRAGWGFQILTNMLPHIPNGVLFGGQGTFPLYAIATDIEGNRIVLGRTSSDNTPTTVTVANDTIAKPFGTIDTPLLGQTVSGVVANFGWVLTPDSNTVPDGTDILMPLNGSTMTVYIDGLATSLVAYNQCRGTVGNPPPAGVFCNDDISNIFGRLVPAVTLTPRTDNPTRYRNLDAARGAIGAYNVNTLALPNGLHTIAWGVSDSAGRGEGIGSRFFTVLNGGAPPSPEASARQGVEPAALLSEPRAGVLSEPPPSPSATARQARPADARAAGAPLGGAPPSPSATARQAPLSPEASASPVFDGAPVVRGAAEDLSRFVTSRRRISGRTGFGAATPFREAGRSREGDAAVRLQSLDRLEIDLDGRVDAGYLVANGELRDLPIGSTLEGARGRFAWMPPAGYLGTYELVFISGSEKTTVRVTVHGESAASGAGTGGGVRVALDQPAAGAITGSPLTIAGWAFDPDAWSDTGIRAVQVWATPLSGFGLPVFAGEATRGLYRADVASVHGEQFSRSGFNLVTSALRRGQYELSINVWSERAGRWEVARKVRVTIR